MTGRRLLALTLATLAVGLVVACDLLVLVHHLHRWPHGYSYWLEGTVAQPVWVAVGLLITLRVPGNRLGWLALAIAVCSGIQLSSGAYATQLAGTGGATRAVDWLAAVSALAQIGLVGGLMAFGYLAPDGRLLSRRWRIPFAALLLALSMVAVNSAMTDAGVRNEVHVARAPLHGISPEALRIGMTTANVIALVAIPAGVASLLLRYRRGSTTQRLQLKWILLAAVVALFLALGVQNLVDHFWPHAGWVGTALWAVIGGCLPSGVAVGVLRYRLYDVDRILSRTIAYALVSAAVAGVYLGIIALADSVAGFSSSVAVAASTLAAAAVFRPLRRRLQRVVDRRFDRAGYDARRIVEQFSGRLRDQVDADAVRADLEGTVVAAVAPAQVSVWLVAS